MFASGSNNFQNKLYAILRILFDRKSFIFQALAIVIIIFAMWGLFRINRIVFDRIKKRQSGIHIVFFERINRAIILIAGTILALSGFGGIGSIWKTFLGGTAIISAVLAFAAQDVIKDVLAGLMISIYKPFEIGNRIEMEDGVAGIVVDITMRHVVLASIETQKLIIPNSRLNSMKLKNYSYHSTNRAAQFTFHIAYGSDVEKAIQVIKQAIIDSPYTVPGRDTVSGKEYGGVYFMAFEDSSLRLLTNVYYKATVPSEVLISDVNTRVHIALAENGIEIPFPYINIVRK